MLVKKEHHSMEVMFLLPIISESAAPPRMHIVHYYFKAVILFTRASAFRRGSTTGTTWTRRGRSFPNLGARRAASRPTTETGEPMFLSST
jgi:hypothetical protein